MSKMVTVSHLVAGYLKGKPALRGSLIKGVINYVGLAEEIQPEIEREIGKKVKTSAIMMSLRRHAEKFEKNFNEKFTKEELSKIELSMKSDIVDITLEKSKSVFQTLKKLQEAVDFEKGDILNIIHGSYEVTILTNERYKEKFLNKLKDEKILLKKSGLSALTLKLTENLLYTPGFIHLITGILEWNNINIIEVVSTFGELTLILDEKDAVQAYKSLQIQLKK